ncbi:MAG: hypothetical protein ABEI97_03930 [Candidatus Nanohaloarchaea archaeon]
MTYRSVAGGEVSDVAAAVLAEIERRERCDDDLTGLRCGAPVCEELLELDAAGRLTIDGIDRDGDTWLVDISPT